jgi:hypothetical protein
MACGGSIALFIGWLTAWLGGEPDRRHCRSRRLAATWVIAWTDSIGSGAVLGASAEAYVVAVSTGGYQADSWLG